MSTFADGKIYLDNNNQQFQAHITPTGNSYKIKFLPIGEQESKDYSDSIPKRKWWKFW